MNDLKLERRPEGLELSSTGTDPHFELLDLQPRDGHPHVLLLELVSESATRAQVFYSTQEDTTYSEAKSVRLSVRVGNNRLLFPLCNRRLGSKLRVDPGRKVGSYFISALELRTVSSDVCAQE